MTSDILLGVVLGPQGLGGDVRVKTFTETPGHIGAYGPLRTAAGQSLEITAMRQVKGDTIIVRFKGIDDRLAAEALANAKLFVPRDALPVTDAEEFYHADLIGLRAQDNEGRVLGEIRAVHNYGAGDVIEIGRDDGGTLLLPFTRNFVPQVDLANKFVVVSEPLDLDAEEEHGIE